MVNSGDKLRCHRGTSRGVSIARTEMVRSLQLS
jgi:hypothetical protein